MASRPLSIAVPELPMPMLLRAAALSGGGAWRCELGDDRLAWTPGVFALFGIGPDERIDRRETVAMYDAESREVMERVRADAISGGDAFTFDARIVRADGSRRWMRVWGEVERCGTRPSALVGWKQDVTAEREYVDRLRAMAERDSLTGLANRAGFHARLDEGLGNGDALVLIDLDGFKQVNDRHGHLAGDACLKMIGDRLTGMLPDAHVAARLGGDEFAALLPCMTRPLALVRRIDALLRHLSLPFVWDGRLLRIGASAGMAFPHGSADPVRWIAAADGALYEAKRMGRGKVRVARG